MIGIERSLISVVIAVRNGERTLAKCLESVASQIYRPVEIVIVNDGSSDATGKICAEFAARQGNVIVITTEGVGPSQARNLAIAKARGIYVAFTDGDCICLPNWLTKLAECIISGPNVAGAGGDQQSPDDDSVYGKFINSFMKTIGFIAGYVKGSDANKIVPTQHNPTCNVMYRKAVFDEVGMFLPNLWPGEDVDLDYRISRAGYQLRYTPEAVVLHYRPGNMGAFARMMYRYGHAQARLVKMHGLFRLIHFVPVAIYLMLIALVFMITRGLLVLAISLTLASCIFVIMYFVARTRNINVSMRYAFHFYITMLFWNTGFIAGMAYLKIPARRENL